MEIREDMSARWDSTVWELTEMARVHSCVPSDVVESKVRALFEEWLGERPDLEAWLNTPQPFLNGDTPRDAIKRQSDIYSLRNILLAIKHALPA